MIAFEEYARKYPSVRMAREDGILELILNTNGGPLIWGHKERTHYEVSEAFADIARDLENRVVIICGTGDVHSGPQATEHTYPWIDPEAWDSIRRNSQECLMTFLSIEAPIISCINGPAYRHAELALLGDIVLASEDALIQDSAHFVHRQVPGDGSHIIYPYLLGRTRASYFMLTGQQLHAGELLELGLVNEVMPRERLLPRAWELARQLVAQNALTLRHTRTLLTQPLREMAMKWLGYGFSLEGHGLLLEAAMKHARDGTA